MVPSKLVKSVALSPESTGFGPLLFAGNITEGIEKASKLGYDAVELSLRNTDELDLNHIKGRLKRGNLEVTGIATGQNYYQDKLSLTSSEKSKRSAAISRLKSLIEFAAELNAQVIIGGIRGSFDSLSWHEKPPDRLYNIVVEGLKVILDKAKSFNVTVALEPINRYETNFINTTKEALKLINHCSKDNFKLLLDSFHMNIEETSYKDAIRQAGDRLSYVHFADNHRLAPGSGHLGFAKIWDALDDIGFSGPVCAEVLPKPNDFLAMKKSLDFLSKKAG